MSYNRNRDRKRKLLPRRVARARWLLIGAVNELTWAALMMQATQESPDSVKRYMEAEAKYELEKDALRALYRSCNGVFHG